MNEKRHESKGDRFSSQLSDQYYPLAADLSGGGMGSWEDMQRYLILPLQHAFSEEVHRDDGGGDMFTEACKRIIHNTLYGQLLFYVLELAGAIGFGLTKLGRLANTLRLTHR